MIPDILTNPCFRPKGVYEFKVIRIVGNRVFIQTLDGGERDIVFDQVDPKVFEEDYKNQISDMYLGIDMGGYAFIYTKEPYVAKWHDVI